MEGLGRVVGMMVIGVPLLTAVATIVIWTQSARPRTAALARTIAIAAVTTAIAWALAIAWVAIHGSNDKATLLAFPALATWWLMLPLAELLVHRRAAA